jgi:hypothetical protein
MSDVTRTDTIISHTSEKTQDNPNWFHVDVSVQFESEKKMSVREWRKFNEASLKMLGEHLDYVLAEIKERYLDTGFERVTVTKTNG